MKDQSTFTAADFFVLRTPLLPFAELLAWSEGLTAPAAIEDPAQLAAALAHDRALLRARMRVSITRPEVQDALFVASPNIIERLHLWTDDPDGERGRKVEHVLVRYFTRMTGRATPFGLFAGCAVGTIGNQTQLTIAGREQYRRHTRLDMDYLDALIAVLARDPSLRESFSYYPNSSLYRSAGRVRYVEGRLKDKLRSYHLVAVEDSDYLAATLARACGGATAEALATALIGDDISLTEARDYISELIASQLLMPDIVPPVTGPEPVPILISQLREHPKTAEAARTLVHTHAALEAIDEAGLGADPERYLTLARQLESLPAKVELSRLFQVDLTKPAPTATLGTAVLAELTRGVDILHSLHSGSEIELLKTFCEAFTARYEEREVPLVEALDEETGIGFGASDDASPLLNDLLFPSPPEASEVPNARRHQLLLRKLSEALQRGATAIDLGASDLEGLSEKNPAALPDAFSVTARLSALSQATLDKGEFQLFIESVSGPSGAVWLGRFCHADPGLQQHVLSHLRVEESYQPQAIFAEIVHLPQGRIGNIVSRPVLRDYEIPYLGRSGATADRQLPITDLYVSVRDGRIRLRSARLNREVIPRLTAAHNYSRDSLGIYKFLCLLSLQGVAGGLIWDWGVLNSAPFLPRVKTGRLVLALARWRVDKDELRELGQHRGADRYQAIQRWRQMRRLPRLVALAELDHVLPIDFDNILSVESFVQLVKEREEAALIELFPASDRLCARGPEGSYTNELIVPFVRNAGDGGRVSGAGERPQYPRPDTRNLTPVHRRFPPGSEWLYIKLYCGTATADVHLREIVRPLTESLLAAGVVDQWFYIRYADPDWHLRLRFHGEPERLRTEALPALHSTIAPLIDDGRIWRMQLDTYEREVERYGGAAGILLAERLFHIDSEAALGIVEMLEPGDEGADERWRLAACGIDRLLADFGCDLKDKHATLKRLRDGFSKEFRGDKGLTSQLSEKFRKEGRRLAELLVVDAAQEHPLAPGLAVLDRRSEGLLPIISELRAREQAGDLSVSLANLLPSYLHMHCNRLLRSAHRQQEFVIYDLLTRLYESQLARAR